MTMMTRVAPHSMIPGLLGPIFQKVPFRETLAEVTRFGKRGDDILYQPTVSRINTPTSIGQQWRGDVDAVGYSLSQLSFPYYTIMARQEFDPNQEAKFERLVTGIGLKAFLDKLCKQGIYQREHYACLFGFDGTSQGLVNQGTAANLPNSSTGKSTIQTYEVPELVANLAAQARTVMTASYNMAKPTVIAGPVNFINYLQSVIVPLTTNQANGGGVQSIAGTYGKIVSEWLGVGPIKWIADDALLGKGAAGNDLVLFIAPGLSEQEAGQPENTNLVAESLEQNMRNTFMDMVDGLKEFTNPVVNGISSSLYSLQTTSGAVIRPEAVRAVSYTF